MNKNICIIQLAKLPFIEVSILIEKLKFNIFLSKLAS